MLWNKTTSQGCGLVHRAGEGKEATVLEQVEGGPNENVSCDQGEGVSVWISQNNCSRQRP